MSDVTERRCLRLISDDVRRSNPSEIPAGLLKFDAYCLRDKGNGEETMSIHAKHFANYPISRRALVIHDILMVSAFGVWALLLGLSPVLVFHALT